MKLIQPYTADSLNPTYAHTALPRTLFKAVGEAFLKSLELRYHLKKKEVINFSLYKQNYFR